MRKFLLFAVLLVSTNMVSQVPDSLGVTLPWDTVYIQSFDSHVGAIPTTANPAIDILEPAIGYILENGDTTEMAIFYPILDFQQGNEYSFVQIVKVDESLTLYSTPDINITYDELPYQLNASDLVENLNPNHTYSFDPNDQSTTDINYDETYLNQGSYSVFVYNHDDRSVGEVNVNVTDCEDYADIDIPATAAVEFDGESVIDLTAELLGVDVFYPCAADYNLVLKHGTIENEVYPSSIGQTISVEVIFNGVVQPENILVSITGEGEAVIPMYIEEKTFTAGEEFTLDIWSDQLDGVLAWQFRLNFLNAQILDITEGLPFDNIPHNIFNDNKTLNSLWTPADTQPVDVSTNETWFTLTILPEVDGSTFDIFTTENDPWSEIVLDDGVSISGAAADFSFQIEERGFLVDTEEVNNNNSLVYNNPVRDRLILSGLDAQSDVSQVLVFSLDGRQLLSDKVVSNNGKIVLDTRSLESGLYILNLNGSTSQSIKFIKI